MGIGMVFVLSKKDAGKAEKILKRDLKMKSWVIGEVVKGRRGVSL